MLSLPTPLKTLLIVMIVAVAAVGTISLSTYIARGPVSSPLEAQTTGTRPGSCGAGCDVRFIRYPRRTCAAGSTCQPIITGSNQGICVQTSCSTSNPCCRQGSSLPTAAPTSGAVGIVKPTTGTAIGGPTSVVNQPTRSIDSGILTITLSPSKTISSIPTGGQNMTPVPVNTDILPNPSTLPISLLGDCSSSTAGVPDGKVDLLDFRQLSIEFTGDATTLRCDFDKNGSVDLIDFNDYFRKGFVGQ